MYETPSKYDVAAVMSYKDRIESSRQIIAEMNQRYDGESSSFREGAAYAIHMLIVHGGIDDLKVGCECFNDEAFFNSWVALFP